MGHLDVDLDQQTRDLSRRPSSGGRIVCGAGLRIVELSTANALILTSADLGVAA